MTAVVNGAAAEAECLFNVALKDAETTERRTNDGAWKSDVFFVFSQHESSAARQLHRWDSDSKVEHLYLTEPPPDTFNVSLQIFLYGATTVSNILGDFFGLQVETLSLWRKRKVRNQETFFCHS